MAVQKYDIRRPVEDGGGFEVRWWSPVNLPVPDSSGELRYIIHRVEDVTEFVRAQDTAKNEFLSRMSHELRTPLNAILGFGQLLELDDLQERQREHVGYILKSGRHLLALIDEVLELSRIEAGRLDLSQEPVSLAEAINEVVALVRPIASEHGVVLDAEFDGLVDDGHVQADRQRLKQVLLNLLSNGIKYNHDGGRVGISFAQTGTGRIRTLVHDSGIGIEPAQSACLEAAQQAVQDALPGGPLFSDATAAISVSISGVRAVTMSGRWP